MKDKKYGTLWTRDELILALYLYCQIPFKKTKANNLEVIRLARLLKRTPASVARKLGNFGAFDPMLASQGISGLAHGSKADLAIWREFEGNWERLVAICEELLKSLHAEENRNEVDAIVAINIDEVTTERAILSKRRVYQDFFRRSVLSSYNNRCCISGVDRPEFLVASHIIPWSKNEKLRLDPQNGLALCVLFDKAFDRGLMTIDHDHRVVFSTEIQRWKNPFLENALLKFEGVKIALPSRFCPKKEFFDWHRNHLFIK